MLGLTLPQFSAHCGSERGTGMKRFGQGLASALLLAGTALHAGCSNSAGGLLATGSAGAPAETPAGLSNEDPAARPVAVAWTSARAKRCGFYFDPAKLKINYLNYERTQGASAEQLAKIEKNYDTTFKGTSDRVAQDPDYCSERKGLDIKADLQRHLAGDYTPNLPKPKPVASCGFWGCAESVSDKPFSSTDFWKEKDKNPKNR
jgi:hypothetical protein